MVRQPNVRCVIDVEGLADIFVKISYSDYQSSVVTENLKVSKTQKKNNINIYFEFKNIYKSLGILYKIFFYSKLQ